MECIVTGVELLAKSQAAGILGSMSDPPRGRKAGQTTEMAAGILVNGCPAAEMKPKLGGGKRGMGKEKLTVVNKLVHVEVVFGVR